MQRARPINEDCCLLSESQRGGASFHISVHSITHHQHKPILSPGFYLMCAAVRMTARKATTLQDMDGVKGFDIVQVLPRPSEINDCLQSLLVALRSDDDRFV
jgi:hypothetical protein